MADIDPLEPFHSFKGYLSSEDMASIINYVRSNFAGKDDGITAERIDALQ